MYTKVIRVRFNGKYFFLISLLIFIFKLKPIIGMITYRNNCALDSKDKTDAEEDALQIGKIALSQSDSFFF